MKFPFEHRGSITPDKIVIKRNGVRDGAKHCNNYGDQQKTLDGMCVFFVSVIHDYSNSYAT